jgi:hypothetical protein
MWCKIIGQHQHISNQHTSSQHISAELCSIATDDMTLSNRLQNAIAAVQVAQTSISKTAKEFEIGSLHKEFIYLKPVKYVRLIQTIQCHTTNINRQ